MVIKILESLKVRYVNQQLNMKYELKYNETQVGKEYHTVCSLMDIMVTDTF